MTTEKTYDDIGLVKYTKSKKAKSVRISLKPFEGVLVTVPWFVPVTAAEMFVKSKKRWIKNAQNKLTKIEGQQTIYNNEVVFKTFKHQLKLIALQQTGVQFKCENGLLYVTYPEVEDLESPRVQKAIKYAIIETLRKEAKEYLPMRTDELATQHNFVYKTIFIKNLKSRWGSCSAVNNVNFNLHLMRLPVELIDYVILHELVHTIHKNHAKRFWDKLEEVCPNSKKLDKALNAYQTQIF